MHAPLEFLLSTVYEGNLSPEHRHDLEDGSGLRAETYRAQGVRSVPPSDFERLLGRHVPVAVRSMLLLPFPDPAGGWFDHVFVKLFPSLVDRRGHSVKYLTRRHASPRVYFVRSALAGVLSPASSLWVVEGLKQCLAATQFGFTGVGITGIHAWHHRGSTALLPDFDLIPLRGRRVELVPDGDVRTNPAVEAGASQLAEALERRGAHVRIVLLPVAA